MTSFWRNIIDGSKKMDGEELGYELAKSGRRMGKYEFTYLVEKCDSKWIRTTFIKDLVNGFNRYAKELNPKAELLSEVDQVKNVYQFGQLLADRKWRLNPEMLDKHLQGLQVYQLEGALYMMTDGYNDRLRDLKYQQKGTNKEKSITR